MTLFPITMDLWIFLFYKGSDNALKSTIGVFLWRAARQFVSDYKSCYLCWLYCCCCLL